MNFQQMILTVAVAASLGFGSPAVRAEYLLPSVEARLQAAADRGPDSLRQFVLRTRMIYALNIEDVADRLEGSGRGDYDAALPSGDASSEAGAGEPEATASPAGDAFTREFFRNDARD